MQTDQQTKRTYADQPLQQPAQNTVIYPTITFQPEPVHAFAMPPTPPEETEKQQSAIVVVYKKNALGFIVHILMSLHKLYLFLVMTFYIVYSFHLIFRHGVIAQYLFSIILATARTVAYLYTFIRTIREPKFLSNRRNLTLFYICFALRVLLLLRNIAVSGSFPISIEFLATFGLETAMVVGMSQQETPTKRSSICALTNPYRPQFNNMIDSNMDASNTVV